MCQTKILNPSGGAEEVYQRKKGEWRAYWSKQWVANYHRAMLQVGRHNKEIRCIICWNDEKSRRKDHDALCHWRECIKEKKWGEGHAVVCIEEAGGRAPNQEGKVSLMKDLQTYTTYLFTSIWKCFSTFVLMYNVFHEGK